MRACLFRRQLCLERKPLTPCDVFIAGAGPAGVALALRLHRLGYDVLLAAPPSKAAHGYETLSPAVQEQLTIEGLPFPLGQAVDFEVRWSSADFQIRAAPARSVVVGRRDFHEGLRRRAIEAGVRLLDGRAETPEHADGCWSLRVAGDSVRARVLVDATGRSGMTRVRRRHVALVGLHAVYEGARLPKAARVAAARGGWVWGAPTPDRRFAVSVFEDPRLGRCGGDPAARIARMVEETHLLDDTATFASQTAVTASDATPSTAPPVERSTLFRIGDASLALDPLSSSGVSAALQSAVDAALSIHTLSLDADAGAMVETFLTGRAQRRAARHAAWTAGFYAEAAALFTTPFWTARAAQAPPAAARRTAALLLDEPIGLGPGVRLRDEPCPVGDGLGMRRVVAPPNAMEPVALVDQIEIVPLLDAVGSGATVRETLALWARHVGDARAAKIFNWAWRSGWLAPLFVA